MSHDNLSGVRIACYGILDAKNSLNMIYGCKSSKTDSEIGLKFDYQNLFLKIYLQNERIDF